MVVMSDLENKFILVDTTKEKDCFVSKEQISKVKAYKLSRDDEFTIVPSHPRAMPELRIGTYLIEIEGQRIPNSL